MRVASINISDYGSTGRIMLQLADAARRAGGEAVTFSRNWWGHGNSEGHVYFGFKTEHFLHHALSYLTGREGSFSFFSTISLIRRLESFRPDIIHLHNLHNWFICLPLLFNYIRENHIRTVWTFHDCWPFTGHCPYFDFTGCEKWRTGCSGCPVYRSYPGSLTDNSPGMYRRKKEWFSGIEGLTVVCPSEWLAGLVRQSFLSQYDIRVIHNGIDTASFRPTDSRIREKLGIGGSDKMVLGVASGWEERKGIDVFAELRKGLGDHFRIVLVGVEEAQKKDLPYGIIPVSRTSSVHELAELYSAADVFVNPTREDNYPTVNLEAIACGTPVVTFDTGGSPESVLEGCGAVVPKDDVEALIKAIDTVSSGKEDRSEYLKKAAESFDSKLMAESYIELYREKSEVQKSSI